ncbi:multidrug ABC transporter ATP-binding protein [marine bacterium AO1-C]|nr:multidrug ABC transporter ATP-binding protein [marine bacterium AO1-C]
MTNASETTSSQHQLKISKLSKTYANGTKALQQVDLHISTGMFGLLGPNGAGKSTFMRILATLQEADSGAAYFNDINILKDKHALRNQLGYLPQEFGLYPKVSAENLLNHLAILKGILHKKTRQQLVASLLQKTNLYDVRKKKVGGFSGGMKQRFGIAQALITNPNLIIVDEPTAGLDPAERNRFYNLLAELGEQAIVILSTHIVEDVKELCTDMAVLNKGQILLKASPAKAIQTLEGKIWEKHVNKAEVAELKTHFQVISEKMFAGKPLVHVYSDSQPTTGFRLVEPDLEDVYFSKIFGATATPALV